MHKIIGLVFVAGVVIGAQNAYAHSLWIEKNKDGNLSVCFGEFGEGLREKSGGKLDKIAHLESWAVKPDGSKDVLQVTKAEDRHVLTSTGGNVIVQDVQIPVRKSEAKKIEKQKPSASKSYLAARFGDGASTGLKPELTLDIVPVGDNAGKVQVFFDGKSLANKDVSVLYANGWMKELKTDAQGFAVIDQPWPGLYVIDVTHTLEKPGTFEGQEYSAERYHTALSLEKK